MKKTRYFATAIVAVGALILCTSCEADKRDTSSVKPSDVSSAPSYPSSSDVTSFHSDIMSDILSDDRDIMSSVDDFFSDIRENGSVGG